MFWCSVVMVVVYRRGFWFKLLQATHPQVSGVAGRVWQRHREGGLDFHLFRPHFYHFITQFNIFLIN